MDTTTVAPAIFEGLNDEQAAAVAAVRGPVCILAGAGTGKTTTITRRIANQVASGAFPSERILAVTFTDKAAGEMAARLGRLGAGTVRARTFHAEALAQYRRISTDPSEIVGSKAQVLASLVSSLPPPHKFTPLRDVATEIEWAKNRRLLPEGYREAAADRDPPIPLDYMAGVYASYERRKARARLIDFEDLLERTIEALLADDAALRAIRDRYQAFTVDEYQDVNLLQQTLLETWVGDRDDLCVVGDDRQSIFGFTGATPAHLLGFPGRYPSCHVVRLADNYRSTPQVLEVANRLVGRMEGPGAPLRATVPPGPAPVFRSFLTGAGEVMWVVDQAQKLHAQGTPWEEMAVLLRINGRSEDFEEALSRRGIPYQVRDSVFLRRPAARSVFQRLKRAAPGTLVAEAVEACVRALGYRDPVEDPEGQDDPDGSGGRSGAQMRNEEATRQADLGRLLNLAREYPGDEGLPGFFADLQRRFASDAEGRGIQLLTYHRAKGLEFDAVFLPRLEEKEIPFVHPKTPMTSEAVAEERRLFYVGITRARRHLFVSWASDRPYERRRRCSPSPFLAEVQPPAPAGASAPASPASPARVRTDRTAPAPAPAAVEAQDAALFDALKAWRLDRAREANVPAYVVFPDRTLAEIAKVRPAGVGDLRAIHGVGPAKITTYGDEVLALVRDHAGNGGPPAG
jgi:DNA helicase-2/ATP-dependent DNA helicase PcrA